MRKLSALLLAGAFCACASNENRPGEEGVSVVPDAQNTSLTYHRDLRPVIETNCSACHVAGGIAPFSLETYDDVVLNANAVVIAVESGIMPPWPVDETCHPVADSRRLSDETRALFASWRDQGMLEGDPGDYEPPMLAVSSTATLSDPDVTMRLGEPYVTDPAITDNYRCFLLPGGFEADTYVTAIDVRPDQRELVHHVQIHVIPAAGVAAAEANDAASDGPGYDCFGGTAISGSRNVYSWRPGAEAVRFPPGDAAVILGGSRIVLQIHYNVHDLEEGVTPPADQSGIVFWTLAPDELPERLVRRTAIFGGVNLPAGEPNVVGEGRWTASQFSVVNGHVLEGEIIGQTPHMHSRGTRLSVTMQREDEPDRCLIDVPNWDFEWQMDYLYPPEHFEPFRANDVFALRCEWDNSADNQPFVRGVQQAPRDVTWGEGTLDEMCMSYFWMRYPRDEYLYALNNPVAPPDAGTADAGAAEAGAGGSPDAGAPAPDAGSTDAASSATIDGGTLDASSIP